MASQTFAKYALPPLHSSSVNEDAPSPLSFKPSKVPVGKTDCSYDISFDSSTLSLTLQFHAKLSQSKTLILHSSTAPFCLSPAVNKNTNVDTSAVVHIKDPTALLPVTYILEVQEDSVSFQVTLNFGQWSRALYIINSSDTRSKSFQDSLGLLKPSL